MGTQESTPYSLDMQKNMVDFDFQLRTDFAERDREGERKRENSESCFTDGQETQRGDSHRLLVSHPGSPRCLSQDALSSKMSLATCPSIFLAQAHADLSLSTKLDILPQRFRVQLT